MEGACRWAGSGAAYGGASLYFLSAWYCILRRGVFSKSELWPRRQWSCWQVLLQYSNGI